MVENSNNNKKNKILPKILIVVIILLKVMTIVVSLSDIDLLIKDLGEIKLIYFSSALFISFIALSLNALSAHIILRAINKDISLKTGFIIQTTETFFNGITPFSSGAQPFQLYYYHKHKVDSEEATSVLVVNFILYQIVSVLLTTIGLIYFWDVISNLATHVKVSIIIGYTINSTILIGLFLLAYIKSAYKLFESILGLFEKFKFTRNIAGKLKVKTFDFVKDFQKGTKFLFTKKRVFILSSLVKLVYLILLFSTTILLSKSLGLNFSFNENIYLMTVSIVASTTMMFVPLPGASGGTEYAFNFMLSNLVIDSNILMLLMLLWRTITYYFGMLYGFIGYLFLKKEDKIENRNIH